MKHLLYILILSPLFCFGQDSGTVYKTGATNQSTIQKGGTGADSLNIVPYMSKARAKLYQTTGAATAKLPGRMVVDTTDKELYYHNNTDFVQLARKAYVDALTDTVNTIATKYDLDTALAGIVQDIEGEHDSLIRYSDTTGYLPTKTFLLNNYFAQGGNSFGATAVLGTNGANNLDFETNNTVRVRFHSGGGATFGGTTNAGYLWDFLGSGTSRFNHTLRVDNTTNSNFAQIVTNVTNPYIELFKSGALDLRFGIDASGDVVIGSGSLTSYATTRVGRFRGVGFDPQFSSTNSAVTLGINSAAGFSTAINMSEVGVVNKGIFGWPAGLTAPFEIWQGPAATSLGAGTPTFRNSQSGNTTIGGWLKTLQPTASGAGEVKLGKILTGSDTNKYWEVEIDGTDYYILLLTALP